MGIALAAGCGAEDRHPYLACTLANCVDGVWLRLVRPKSQATLPLAGGQYELEVSYDDVSDVCTALLPQRDAAFTCADGAAHRVGYSSGPGVRVGLFVEIEGHTPATVSVALLRDGTPVASEIFELTYTELAPNGVECGPVCQRATVEATLPRQE